MEKPNGIPKTLLEAVQYFSDPDVCLRFVAALRWSNGPVCPRCGTVDPGFLTTRRLWQCKSCQKQFSVKVGTIFEDSPIGLAKWLPAFWMVVNCKNGVSSYEVARAIGVTLKSAWFMTHRIRLALQTGTFKKLSGEIEADESFIGGRARYMHKGRRNKAIKGRGPMGMAVVMGLLQRHGEDGHSTVVLKHVPNIRRRVRAPEVRAHVEPGSEVFIDALRSYDGLAAEYAHKVIDHAEKYAEGKVHTNGLENFWSLFKRSVKGTYVSVEPFHLFRYLDEQSYRFNNRKMPDGERFVRALHGVIGKRLTYKSLIGEATTGGATA